MPFTVACTKVPTSVLGMQPYSSCVCASNSVFARHYLPVNLRSQFCCGSPQLHQHLSSEKLLLATNGQWIHAVQVTINGGCTRVNAVTEFTNPAIDFTLEDIKAAGTTEAVSDLRGLSISTSSELQSSSFFSKVGSPPIPVELQHANSSVERISGLFLASDMSSGDGTVLPDIIPLSPDISQLDKYPNLESLKPSVEAVFNAADATTDSTTQAAKIAEDVLSNVQSNAIEKADEALSKTQSAVESESFTSAMDAATKIVLKASKDVTDGVEETKSAILDAVNTSQESFISFFTKIQESVQRSVTNAGSAVRNSYDNLNKSILSSIKTNTGFDVQSANEIKTEANRTLFSAQENTLDFTSPFRMGTPTNNALKEVVSVVENVTGFAFESAGKLATEVYNVTKGALPLDAQSSVNVAEKRILEFVAPVGSAFQQAYHIITDTERALGVDPENPVIPVILLVGTTIFIGLTYSQSKYGGYSGDLSPKVAFDLLRREHNVVLVDTRSEELRQLEGIPDLRRQARHKFANVERVKVQDALRQLLKNANHLDDSITAAIITGLKNVESKTKVILIDADGSQSKAIARALRKAGIKRSYRVEGGFRSWKADGLRVKQTGPETALSIIKEETEAILEEMNPTPEGIILIAVGSVAGIYALIEWEKTLQLLGFIGLAQLTYNRFNAYENVNDLKDDLRVVLRPLSIATQAIIWIAGQMEPSKLQLATSPSNSAVQDRVLQAAAKHGPSPSELEQQQETQPLETGVSDDTIASSHVE